MNNTFFYWSYRGESHLKLERRCFLTCFYTKANRSLLRLITEGEQMKKSLGVLSLIIFVFAFAGPLLLLTPPAAGTDNYTYHQPYTKYFYCPDGTVLYTISGTTVSTATVDHPENYVYIYGYDCGFDPELGYVCKPQRISAHTDHEMTHIYPTNEVKYRRDASPRACR